ncbi:MAG: PQQ-binding-like beta-propeller repeat protein [Tepidisphaeraceae bacterium]
MPQLDTLAVVPIFITAGSAVLPAVLAGVAGVAAVLLRPGEWAGLVRRRPVVSASVVAVLGLGVWGGVELLSTKPAKAAPAGTDWAAVARQIIDRQAAMALASQPGTVSAASATATVEARDFSRSSYDNGPAPRDLKTLWTYAPEDTMFLASPAVVGDRIYVAGCVTGLGDYTGSLACIDANTGRPIWEVSEANGEALKAFFSSPAVTADGKSVIVGQGFHQDRNCPLLCFDADTGKLRWSAATTEHVESSPAVIGDLAVVGVGAIEDKSGRPTGDAGHVLAVRVSDGRVLWRHPVIDAESSPAVDSDGTVIIGSGLNGNAIVGIKSPDDKPATLWKTDVGLTAAGSVTLAGDLAIIGAGNGNLAVSSGKPEGVAVAVDRRTGDVRWKFKTDDAVLGPIAYRDGLLIVPTRSDSVIALNADDGTERWRTSINRAVPILAGAAITDAFVYVHASDGTLAVLDKVTGKILEKHAMNDPSKTAVGLASAAPQVIRGRVYVASETGGLRCLVGTVGGQQ